MTSSRARLASATTPAPRQGARRRLREDRVRLKLSPNRSDVGKILFLAALAATTCSSARTCARSSPLPAARRRWERVLAASADRHREGHPPRPASIGSRTTAAGSRGLWSASCCRPRIRRPVEGDHICRPDARARAQARWTIRFYPWQHAPKAYRPEGAGRLTKVPNGVTTVLLARHPDLLLHAPRAFGSAPGATEALHGSLPTSLYQFLLKTVSRSLQRPQDSDRRGEPLDHVGSRTISPARRFAHLFEHYVQGSDTSITPTSRVGPHLSPRVERTTATRPNYSRRADVDARLTLSPKRPHWHFLALSTIRSRPPGCRADEKRQRENQP